MFYFTVLNVAVGKAAMQSSSVGQGTAQKAIDGSKYYTNSQHFFRMLLAVLTTILKLYF